MSTSRKAYTSDGSDDERALVPPYLDAAARGVEWVALRREDGRRGDRGPTNLPPWHAVYQQARRGLWMGCFEQLAEDLRAVLRLASGHKAEPTAAILDSRTLCSSPENSKRAGYDGAKRKKGSKLHIAIDTLGHLLALHITSADADERAQVGHLAKAVLAATGDSLEIGFVDQGYTGDKPSKAARAHGIELAIVMLLEAKRSFVLLPRRWIVERSFAWATRFRRLVKDYERYASTLVDLQNCTSSPSSASCSERPLYWRQVYNSL